MVVCLQINRDWNLGFDQAAGSLRSEESPQVLHCYCVSNISQRPSASTIISNKHMPKQRQQAATSQDRIPPEHGDLMEPPCRSSVPSSPAGISSCFSLCQVVFFFGSPPALPRSRLTSWLIHLYFSWWFPAFSEGDSRQIKGLNVSYSAVRAQGFGFFPVELRRELRLFNEHGTRFVVGLQSTGATVGG